MNMALSHTGALRWPLLAAMMTAACTSPAPEPMPITKPGDATGAAVVRRPIAEPAPPAVASIEQPRTGIPSTSPIVAPPGVQYVCVSESAGQRQQTAIEFSPKVRELCTKHPEMMPCQYERNVCRRSGGRVFEANGTEITMATEAEYDKKVMRVRFKSN
jgi:hypothetical protein